MTRADAIATLKPGNRVLVARKVNPCREGWFPGHMDETVGKELCVTRVSPNGAVLMTTGWWYPAEALEPAVYGNEEDDDGHS